MTSTEFKHWLEGYCKSIQGKRPNVQQWHEIVETIKKMDDRTVYLSSPGLASPGLLPNPLPYPHITNR